MTTHGGFNAACDLYFGEYMDKIEHCIGLLDEDEVWRRPAPGTNSIGNLLLHLTGNLSLWVLNSLCGEHNPRNRSEEFTAERTLDTTQLVERLRAIVERCRLNTRTLSAETLAAPLDIQGYATDGMGALFHAVEHMSYHTGQIVYWTKVLISGRAEIEFYPQHHGE